MSLLNKATKIIGLDPKKTTQSQVPLETEEQRLARKKLLEFANSGVFGKFNAGEEIPLGYGDYNMGQLEQQGQSSLSSLLGSGIPEQYQMGDAALRDLIDTSPTGIDSMFAPFKDIVNRNTREGADAVKRNAAFAGNLYSTNTIKGLGDVEARGNETMAAELARLTEGALNRKYNAATALQSSGGAQEGLLQNRIQSSQLYGGLARSLNDQKIKARDNEIMRRRQELSLPIQAATTVSGQSSNFGIPSITTSEPSTLMQLLQILGPAAGAYMGAGRA